MAWMTNPYEKVAAGLFLALAVGDWAMRLLNWDISELGWVSLLVGGV